MRTRKATLPQVLETPEQLRQMMSACGDPLVYKRLLALSLVRRGQATSRAQLARQLMVSHDAVCAWFKTYEHEGIEALASRRKSGPKSQRILSPEAFEALGERLQGEGFDSFLQAQHWLEQQFDLELNYKSLWRLIKREWGGKLKVGRPSNPKKTSASGAPGR